MSADLTHTSQDVETDHVYDGIQEFDNPLPRWWLLTFYGAIVFAVGYWIFYQTSGAGLTQMEAYTEVMVAADAKLAEAAANISEDALLAVAEDGARVSEGREIFEGNCVACHAAGGLGLVGPNLTDAYWIHGGSAKDIFVVVNKGVLAKGMPEWGPILGPNAVQSVTAYVLSLRDTNVPGKAPEGVNQAGDPAPAAN